VGWVLPAGVDSPDPATLLEPESLRFPEVHEVPGRVLGQVWDVVAGNSDQLRLDIHEIHPRSDAFLPPGVNHLGRDLMSVARGVELEPGITLDTRAGPIRIDEGAHVRSFSRLEGPLHIGRNSHILGGSVGRASIGPTCKVRGEVEESILLGFVNKAHDGYLGHALVGRWVNLGAMTTNSDLKNNYAPVRVRTAAGEIDTGLTKVGCFLGDHVKTGIGTLLNTGCVVGAGSNLFGGAMPPARVPPFSWGAGSALTEFRLDRFLEVAEVVMARRSVELTPGMRDFLTAAWERTRTERSEG
jgi:UDP-N-acetylglucosamine diphosphorylase / glucose-1-phosphate thymidylyltransferase / UDP-N-acetylgalactosamine diphosphorylase / glucosamine-1-phosphate N-acetyltransferase / galactosamine-1-phosphate N-acetyltransferase